MNSANNRGTRSSRRRGRRPEPRSGRRSPRRQPPLRRLRPPAPTRPTDATMNIGFFTDSYFPGIDGVTYTIQAWRD
ncbi:hypothetical protein EXE40_17475, partial [Halorubrum sp. GN11GM_10-3_MGM]